MTPEQIMDAHECGQFRDLMEGAESETTVSKPTGGITAQTPEALFQGGGDVGAQSDSIMQQLTKTDLESMTPEQIMDAHSKGLLRDLTGS